MNVLVLGGGAREHAVAWKLAQSPQVTTLHCAPGNGGTGAHFHNHTINPEDSVAVVALAKKLAIDFVFVGPEAPLVAGVADALRAENISVFGPGKSSAQLEGSKIVAKEFMARHRIPTASFRVFHSADEALSYVRHENRALVVKADGLAGGKGVVVAQSTSEAEAAIESMMQQRIYGQAGARILIEDCLVGPEISYHVVSDGQRYVPLAACQDHKRLRDHDQGPNTGGMGAYSPPPFFSDAIQDKVLRKIVEPTFRGLAAEGLAYRGVLFIGLMIVGDEPFVLEYNVRFGDPETQVLMMRWSGDVMPLLYGAATGNFGDLREPTWDAPAAMSVVLAARGYPENPERGALIHQHTRPVDAEIFHAGSKQTAEGLVVSGGRVLTVTAKGTSVAEAKARAYHAIAAVAFEGMQMRSDIGHQAIP